MSGSDWLVSMRWHGLRRNSVEPIGTQGPPHTGCPWWDGTWQSHFSPGQQNGSSLRTESQGSKLDRALASSCFRGPAGMAWCLSVRTGLVGKLKVVPLRAVHHEPFTMWFNRAVGGLFRSMQKVGSVLGVAR